MALSLFGTGVAAQPLAQGYAVERLTPSAAGAGWFVMDALDMHGPLGGAMSLHVGYARNPLRLSDGAGALAVVSTAAFADVGVALTWERLRVSLNLDMPLALLGARGTFGGFRYVGPDIDPSSHPDSLGDARLGVDVRLFGSHRGALRLGLGAQLIVPFGNRDEYLTDDTYRATFRALAAGDAGRFAWAAQLGVHVRPLDDSPAPGSPQGSELTFGVAAGVRARLGDAGEWALVAGPEVFGATALRALFGGGATALEAMLSSRVETTGPRGVQVRVKLGAGGGLVQGFGSPDARVVMGIELFGRGR